MSSRRGLWSAPPQLFDRGFGELGVDVFRDIGHSALHLAVIDVERRLGLEVVNVDRAVHVDALG